MPISAPSRVTGSASSSVHPRTTAIHAPSNLAVTKSTKTLPRTSIEGDSSRRSPVPGMIDHLGAWSDQVARADRE
jgi:hypothetical protein